MKKLKKEAIAKAEAAAKDAATKGPKERSPFIKEVQMKPSCRRMLWLWQAPGVSPH